ncbi:16S rRNA (cytidine(1402)-2'-O)-methyltransferase [Gammaproteobacteria bacterium LSUCC0057]|uniref:Ribosomal RNA small subunit methyltransferase I n=1 Tax=Gammaproteobacteria bacterium LSUCC0057 TaxID=2559237 RepID=A0A4Y8UFS0_9GAMM|nr:16S rRNA (cytidine(1402)-2'-O)-methyltransferase [Gammaproteobacteria bacterium LSUCC0057]
MYTERSTLYVVATPIGNLADITQRAAAVLAEVDLIACEDTRHSQRLLDHLQLNKPLRPYHEHSDGKAEANLLESLAAGQSIALISDAGTPLIADPGYRLVSAARAAGYSVVTVPGPCAAIAALSIAGLPSDQFRFCGFLPARAVARDKVLEQLTDDRATLIFYEAPHRIVESLAAMAKICGGERRAAIGRELTKTFETLLAGTLAELAERVANDRDQQRGEIVVMVAGQLQRSSGSAESRRVLQLLLQELPLKRAAAVAAQLLGGDKRSFYQLGLQLQERSR